MTILYSTLIFSLVQGITEFLPISSTAHLFLLSTFFQADQNNIVFDLVLNIGSLMTIIVYYRKSIATMLVELFNIAKSPKKIKHNWLSIKIIIATLPVIIIGYIFTVLNLEYWLRNPLVIAICLIVFGVVLYLVDKKQSANKKMTNLTYKSSFTIGLWQCLALIPGVSRSGITITASRAQNLTRKDAVNFSFLIAIPSILGAVTLNLFSIVGQKLSINPYYLILGVITTFVVGLIFINILMSFIKKYDFKIFMYYRIIIGLIIIIYYTIKSI